MLGLSSPPGSPGRSLLGTGLVEGGVGRADRRPRLLGGHGGPHPPGAEPPPRGPRSRTPRAAAVRRVRWSSALLELGLSRDAARPPRHPLRFQTCDLGIRGDRIGLAAHDVGRRGIELRRPACDAGIGGRDALRAPRLPSASARARRGPERGRSRRAAGRRRRAGRLAGPAGCPDREIDDVTADLRRDARRSWRGRWRRPSAGESPTAARRPTTATTAPATMSRRRAPATRRAPESRRLRRRHRLAPEDATQRTGVTRIAGSNRRALAGRDRIDPTRMKSCRRVSADHQAASRTENRNRR